jgi:hypothetical protein
MSPKWRILPTDSTYNSCIHRVLIRDCTHFKLHPLWLSGSSENVESHHGGTAFMDCDSEAKPVPNGTRNAL